jgi:hypothetical protein
MNCETTTLALGFEDTEGPVDTVYGRAWSARTSSEAGRRVAHHGRSPVVPQSAESRRSTVRRVGMRVIVGNIPDRTRAQSPAGAVALSRPRAICA